MKQNVAMARYLQRHIETGLPDAPADSIQTDTSRWHHVIVIPCYDESPALLANFADLATDRPTLIILILNRPESCPDAAINCALRTAIANLATVIQATATQAPVYGVTNSVELYCHDLERLSGPSPNTQGVGLARKVGCNIQPVDMQYRCRRCITSRLFFEAGTVRYVQQRCSISLCSHCR
jgi:hypothetical protein